LEPSDEFDRTQAWTDVMKDLFFSLVEYATGALTGNEVLLANFCGEQSDFVRFNRACVRQAMTVTQAAIELTLIDGGRRDKVALTVTGDRPLDRAAVTEALDTMRRDLPSLPPDPYLLYSAESGSSQREQAGQLPSAEEVIDAIISAAQGTDLVGVWCSGPIYRGFASSVGARHWHAVDSFLFDWSLYHATDKAVKSAWAGDTWSRAKLSSRMERAKSQLAFLARPAKTLAPGEYRAYLAPAAVDELLWMLNWGGVSAKSQRTKQSCLQRLVDGEMELSPQITLHERTAGGLAPAFDEAGFTKPDAVELIVDGRHAGSMVSPRSAKEYELKTNGAAEDESMASMTLAPGALAAEDTLRALDTGIAIGNLHYLNFSDRRNARVTGMTRFATFWVEHGVIQAPLNVMRFDESLYRMLGDRLLGLTSERDLVLSTSTYHQRSTGSSRVPGALVDDFNFTL